MNSPGIDLPDTIRSERLIIRAPRPGDGQKVFAATVESLDALRAFPAFMPWALAEPSVEASEAYCRTAAANFLARRDFPVLFLLRDAGDAEILIGCSGLHRPRWDTRTFEIGWWGRTPFMGRGLMTEGVSALLDFAFSAALAARRVEAVTDDANARSWRLCERAGMNLEKIVPRERTAPDGSLRNTRIYAKTARRDL